MVYILLLIVGIILFIVGINKLLKVKEEETNQNYRTEEYAKDTTNKETDKHEDKPIEIDCRKNSWQFYCYKVSGTNPKTNRKKKVSVCVLNNDEDYIKEKSGLIDVTEIEETFIDKPTENQIRYGEKFGMVFSSELNKRDYSMLLSRAEGEAKYEIVPLGVAQFAERFNVYLSSYATTEMAYNLIFDTMNTKEKCLLLVHTVLQLSNGFTSYDYINHPSFAYYEDFANEFIEDDNVGKIIKNYSGTLFVPNKKRIRTIKPYNYCYNYLVRKGLIQE